MPLRVSAGKTVCSASAASANWKRGARAEVPPHRTVRMAALLRSCLALAALIHDQGDGCMKDGVLEGRLVKAEQAKPKRVRNLSQPSYCNQEPKIIMNIKQPRHTFSRTHLAVVVPDG